MRGGGGRPRRCARKRLYATQLTNARIRSTRTPSVMKIPLAIVESAESGKEMKDGQSKSSSPRVIDGNRGTQPC